MTSFCPSGTARRCDYETRSSSASTSQVDQSDRGSSRTTQRSAAPTADITKTTNSSATDNRSEGEPLNSWTITNLDLRPHSPEILASTDDARAIALMIPAGESFDDHQVHESAWVTVIDGEVEITTSDGQSVIGSTGLVVAFAPNERHALHARSDARLLLLLTPWPGVDHPGAMTLEQKPTARTPDRGGGIAALAPPWPATATIHRVARVWSSTTSGVLETSASTQSPATSL